MSATEHPAFALRLSSDNNSEDLLDESYPRFTLVIAVIGIVGTAIEGLQNGWHTPVAVFFLSCAALALVAFVLWGLNTPVIVTSAMLTVEFDTEGNAEVLCEQNVMALRRTVTELNDRMGSDGQLILHELSMDGVANHPVIEPDDGHLCRVRQILHTSLPLFRRSKRRVRFEMQNSYCAASEFFQTEPAYPMWLAKVRLRFPASRSPETVHVYVRKGAAAFSAGILKVQHSNDSHHVAEWQRFLPGIVQSYRFEWNWSRVHGGKNARTAPVIRFGDEIPRSSGEWSA